MAFYNAASRLSWAWIAFSVAEHVYVEVDRTPLPVSLWVVLNSPFDEADTGIRDDKSRSLETTAFEVLQEGAPTGLNDSAFRMLLAKTMAA